MYLKAERCGDGEDWVEASEDGAEEDHLARLRVHRQLRQVEPQRRQLLAIPLQGVDVHLEIISTFSNHIT